MAQTAILEGPPTRHTSRLSWGAVFGGTVVAIGTWMLLNALGLALGLSAIDPDNPASARAAGIGTGIWGVISPLISLFVGGAVASRLAGSIERGAAVLHGAVLWGLSVIVGTLVVGMALSSLVSGAVGLAGRAAGAAGGAVAGAAQSGKAGDVAEGLGLSFDDALAPLNQRLQAEGKPAVTPEQLKSATRDAINDGIRQGRLDRALLTQSIAQQTALSQSDAEELAGQVEASFNAQRQQLSERVGQAGQQVQTTALKAADATGRAFWGIFAALLLSLVSAILGAVTGHSRRQRYDSAATRVVVPERRAEVHP